jgi:sec-independent protein translocase protein TatA
MENPWHIAILVVVLLLVFGSKRLPEMGRSLGTGMREFKRSISSHGDDPPVSELLPTSSNTPAANERPAGRRDLDTIT